MVRSDLSIVVLERGNLESQKTVDGVCELESYENKIIFIVEEGSTVEKGDVVVRFDSSKIDKEIAQQEITVNTAKSQVESTRQEVEIAKNQGESDVAAAELELELAKLDLKKYELGDYEVSLQDLKGKIALAEFELSKAEIEHENFKTLVKKGFRETEQLRSFEQSVQSAEFNLARDRRALLVLEEYDHVRKLKEYRANATEAVRKVARAKANAQANVTKAESAYDAAVAALKLEEDQLAELNDQLTKCEIRAEQTGVLAYANEEWFDSDRRIREGAVVHQRQKIFSLPDMSLLQTKLNIHESVVKKVRVDQKATIRVTSFPGFAFEGTVKSVSQLADSSDSWRRGGVKEYPTVVILDQVPEVEIRPGMTAEVEIRVDELIGVLAVPVQSVTEHQHQHFVYRFDQGEFVRTPVTIGQTNERFVEIKEGISDGDRVALDARARGLDDFQDEDIDSDAASEGNNEAEEASQSSDVTTP